MPDIEKVMSWLEGLTQDDWRELYSDSEVQNTAKAALQLLEAQQADINALKRACNDLAEKGQPGPVQGLQAFPYRTERMFATPFCYLFQQWLLVLRRRRTQGRSVKWE